MNLIMEFCLSWALMWEGPQNLRTLPNSSGLLAQLRIALRPSERLCNFSSGPKYQIFVFFASRGKDESEPIQNLAK